MLPFASPLVNGRGARFVSACNYNPKSSNLEGCAGSRPEDGYVKRWRGWHVELCSLSLESQSVAMGTFCSGLITFDDQVDGARQTQDPVDPGRSSEEGRHDLSKRQWLPAIADALPSSPSCMEHALPSAVRSASGNGLERAQTCADAHNGAAAPGPVTSGAGYCAGEGSLSFVAAQATEQSQKNAADTPTELQHHEPRLREQAASYVHRPVEERTSNEASTVSGLETHGLVGDRAGKGQAPLVAGQGDSLKFCSGSSNGCAGCRPLMDNVVASVESVLSVDKDISNASVQNPAQGVEQDGISYADAVIAGIKLVEPENEAVQLAELANSAGTSIEGLLNFNYTAAPDTGKRLFLAWTASSPQVERGLVRSDTCR